MPSWDHKGFSARNPKDRSEGRRTSPLLAAAHDRTPTGKGHMRKFAATLALTAALVAAIGASLAAVAVFTPARQAAHAFATPAAQAATHHSVASYDTGWSCWGAGVGATVRWSGDWRDGYLLVCGGNAHWWMVHTHPA